MGERLRGSFACADQQEWRATSSDGKIAVVACVAAAKRQALPIVTLFLLGLVSAYASFGFAAALLGRLLDIANWIYAMVALALLVGGILTLLPPNTHTACRTYAPTRHGFPMSLGGVFLLGASFACVIAPCCTPLVSTIVAYTAAVGDPWYGAALLALFALGHGLPIVLLGLGSGAFIARVRAAVLHEATSVASGALMIVLSAFYWCLV